ncbi:MAG: hypothetical protein IJW00_01525 [Clostridia bacterium]|nr:hypothetical protein [Clostridia bacterium]
MKLKTFLSLFCTLGLLCAMLTACRSHGLLSDDFDAGDTVTPEELLEISRAIFETAAEPDDESSGETSEPETLSPDATVYWLKKGSVYHAKKDCYHISHASEDEICSGKIPEAESEGKERLCASCAP